VVGKGGMGTVHAGVDRRDGRRVAIKVLHCSDDDDRIRFEREAGSLEQLSHPSIVGLLAHGAAPDGTPFLVMEWLEGHDLAVQLRRGGPLTLAATLEVGVRAAGALALAHRHGLVHRDVKPSNLFLVGGDPARATLIDFGLARSTLSRPATRTGWLLGTPGYMAPEQARGARDIDARADVFSLGSVLFECLTGRPLFAANHPMAVLAKLLLEEPPRLRQVVPSAPAALDRLLARMLGKTREGRPADGAAVETELAALAGSLAPADLARVAGPTASTATDSAEPEGASETATAPPGASLTSITGVAPVLSHDEQGRLFVLLFHTPASALVAGAHTAPDLAPLAAPFQMRAHSLADGSWLFTQVSSATAVEGATSAIDGAASAARCALALLSAIPSARLALANGVGRIHGGLPVGQVIDRAAGLLAGVPASIAGVVVDEVTASLLEARFVVSASAGQMWVSAERPGIEALRPILGRPGPFVGRAGELGHLMGHFEEVCDVARPGATLIEAPPGVGKTRLLRELWVRLAGHPHRPGLWLAAGHPLREGSALAIVTGLLRARFGLTGDEPPSGGRDLLLARMVEAVGPAQGRRMAEFLGELLGLAFPAEESPALLNARRDPTVMGDQVRRAFADLVESDAARTPLVIAIDDLHWADAASLTLLVTALQRPQARAVWVVGLCRPGAEAQRAALAPLLPAELALPPLSSRAAEQLIRAVLGPTAAGDTVARLVALGDGNALFLEELIRAAAAGRTDALPETVVAMVHARLASRPAVERRVLRAASLFGDTFWDEGVAALLANLDRAELARALHDLEHVELIHASARRRFHGSAEHSFHHALIREAAYSHLTDDDCRTGHAAAGAWLELAGERDPLVLALHFERGGEPARAAAHYARAAEVALEASQLPLAMERAQRAIACGAAGVELGRLRLLQAEVLRWQADFEAAYASALESLNQLPEASSSWYRAAGLVAVMASRRNDMAALERWSTAILQSSPAEADRATQLSALCRAVFQIVLRFPAYREWLDRTYALADHAGVSDPAAVLQLESLRWLDCSSAGVVDYQRTLAHVQAAVAAAERGGDVRNACLERAVMAESLLWSGQVEAALETTSAVLVEAARLGLDAVVQYAELAPSVALIYQDDFAGLEARIEQLSRAPATRRPSDGWLTWMRCELLVHQGRFDEAVALLGPERPWDSYLERRLVTVKGRALLGAGQLEAAAELTLAPRWMNSPFGVDGPTEVQVKALLGAGRQNEARERLRWALQHLVAEMALMPAELHPGYLKVPWRAALLEMSLHWLDEDERAAFTFLFGERPSV
jgi:hypothetical protein